MALHQGFSNHNKVIIKPKYITIFLLVTILCHTECAYKTPEKNDPRNRPRKVSAQIEDANTLILHWEAPITSEGGCEVKRYRVRLKREGDRRSKTWKVDGQQTSLRIHDLVQDSEYAVRLNAVNCERQRARTRWIKVNTRELGSGSSDLWEEDGSSTPDVMEEGLPGKPTVVRTRTYSTSVLVSWQPPEPGEIVRGYKVGYSQNVPNLNWRYVDASQRNITLEGLRPSTQYVISLCAYNNHGEGPVMYELIYTLEENMAEPTQPPFVPPTNLRAKVLSPTSAWLQWSDPTLGPVTQILDNRYYNVQYQALPSGKSLSVIVKALHVVLYDLVPGTTYEFKVRTMKAQKYTAFSYTIRNRTFEAAPSTPPRQLSVHTNNDTNSVTVTWRPPKQPNGIITAYHLMFTTDQRLPDSRWVLHTITGADTTATLPLLKPNSTYYFKIQAHNSQGASPYSSIKSFLTNPLPSDFRNQLANGRNEVSANDPDDNAGDGDDEMLGREQLHNKQPSFRKTLPGQNDKDTNFVDKLAGTDINPSVFPSESSAIENNINYMAQMQGDDSSLFPTSTRNAPGDGIGVRTAALKQERSNPLDIPMEDDWRASSNIVSPPLEASFQSLVRYSVSAVLKWDVPCYDRPREPVEYVIRYYLADDASSYIDKTSPTNFVILDNLRPNSFYAFKVKRISHNQKESGWSEEGTFVTNYPLT